MCSLPSCGILIDNRHGRLMLAKVGENREMASREGNIEWYTPSIELGVFSTLKTHSHFYMAIDFLELTFGVAASMVEAYSSSS